MAATSAVVRSVVGLWRSPVKSMSGEQVEQADVSTHGLVGDRALALIDAVTGKVVSAKIGLGAMVSALARALLRAGHRVTVWNRTTTKARGIMRRVLMAVLAALCCASLRASSDSYLFMWAGDAGHKASDFLAVIDASPTSAGYGRIVTSIPTGEAGTHPHHTEHQMPASGHLLANGFHAGRTWLFDLSQPLHPRILTSFSDVAGFSHPHTFIRLANGHVLTTFQYGATPGTVRHAGGHGAAPESVERSTGGLVEMNERGSPIRSGSASDAAIADKRIYPYSVLPLPAYDLAVSTTTDMDENNVKATSEWVQFWRLSDLKLLRSLRLTPGPRGDEHQLTGEPRLLADGQSIYIHTFKCGLYLVRGVERPEPSMTFVRGFQGKDCGVPVLTGHHWLQTVPEAHAVISLDISDPEHPREVSKLMVGEDEQPHWLSIDPTGRRVVLNSSGGGKGNRLFVINFDPGTGQLSLDDRFRDKDSTRPGITLTGRKWPHGFSGTAVPHGTVFSR